ncbi:Holliday junction resolvase RuvX [Thermopetrobacter sp. TC1]|uniref:Holliday junction resolvase RuvX n=1 Tax=Thermopetrobacter sp. TC1 TaxID=1495045 RepID=UPI00056FC9C8|nr:Holliday junction resolvase RuvX [Thermopetrobacter sp. TC1]
MTITIEELAARLKEGQRLLGLDLGTKTIGLALSDGLLLTATPLETIKRTRFRKDAEKLLTLAARENVGGFILGYPVNMNGSVGPRAQATRAFARNLEQISDIPVVLWDERLSTAGVERTLLEADVSRKRRADVVDKMAAAWILQGALDRLRSLRG